MLLFIRKNFVFTFAYVLCAILTDYLFGGVRLYGFICLGQYVVWVLFVWIDRSFGSCNLIDSLLAKYLV